MIPRSSIVFASVLVLVVLHSIWSLATFNPAPAPLQFNPAKSFNLRALLANATSGCIIAENSPRAKYALALCTVRDLARSHAAWQIDRLRIQQFTPSDSVFTYTPGAAACTQYMIIMSRCAANVFNISYPLRRTRRIRQPRQGPHQCVCCVHCSPQHLRIPLGRSTPLALCIGQCSACCV